METFEKFKEIIREEVSSRVDADVRLEEVVKNNGLKLDAIAIKSNTTSITPVIYLEKFYEAFCDGKSIEDIAEAIIKLNERESGLDNGIINEFTNYDFIKSYLQTKLISKEHNSELLETVPYKEFLDLALVCVLNIPFEEDSSEGVAMVGKNLVSIWGVSEEEMFEVAMTNSMSKNPAMIKSLNEIISDMYNDDFMEEQEENEILDLVRCAESCMYVMTTSNKINGAVTITFENVLKQFAEEKESDFYILPSSIHEVIIVPADDNSDAEVFRDMVQSVNRTAVASNEILSDNVYYYNRETNKITIA